MIPVGLRTARIGRRGRPFLLHLVHLSIQQRDSSSLVLRLRVLGRSSGGRIMVGREVPEMRICLVICKMVV
jgi:hypothetical protein